MPPRWFCWLIVMFWVTTMGWLFWRDLWPNWRPGEPPPFHIDDVAEVVQKSTIKVKTYWTVERGEVGKSQLNRVFRAETWVDSNPNQDTYSLHAKFETVKNPLPNLRPNAPKVPPAQEFYVSKVLKIERMTSEYRVTRAGRLHSLEATVTAKFDPDRLGGGLIPRLVSILRPQLDNKGEKDASERVLLCVWGEVRENHFFAHCCAGVVSSSEPVGVTPTNELISRKSLSKPIQLDLPPTPVSHTGSVLMPLHPVSRVSGLRPGQHWHQPLVDPLRDSFAALPGTRSLNAYVLPQPQMLKWGTSETSCLVIEYTDDENEPMGRTWVERSTNNVLQQEAILEGSRWIMTRDPQRGVSKIFPDG